MKIRGGTGRRQNVRLLVARLRDYYAGSYLEPAEHESSGALARCAAVIMDAADYIELLSDDDPRIRQMERAGYFGAEAADKEQATFGEAAEYLIGSANGLLELDGTPSRFANALARVAVFDEERRLTTEIGDAGNATPSHEGFAAVLEGFGLIETHDLIRLDRRRRMARVSLNEKKAEAALDEIRSAIQRVLDRSHPWLMFSMKGAAYGLEDAWYELDESYRNHVRHVFAEGEDEFAVIFGWVLRRARTEHPRALRS